MQPLVALVGRRIPTIKLLGLSSVASLLSLLSAVRATLSLTSSPSPTAPPLSSPSLSTESLFFASPWPPSMSGASSTLLLVVAISQEILLLQAFPCCPSLSSVAAICAMRHATLARLRPTTVALLSSSGLLATGYLIPRTYRMRSHCALPSLRILEHPNLTVVRMLQRPHHHQLCACCWGTPAWREDLYNRLYLFRCIQ
jgi:hypothetical protein